MVSSKSRKQADINIRKKGGLLRSSRGKKYPKYILMPMSYMSKELGKLPKGLTTKQVIKKEMRKRR